MKGKDDLRQDLVMQQTFHMCNALLRSAPETRRRRLHINTYKVLPLTPAAGVLEWVSETTPIGRWINDEVQFTGARQRYRPNEVSFTECRKVFYFTKKRKKKIFFHQLSSFYFKSMNFSKLSIIY